ncbi:hypothetical protein CC80DRAFT_547240 [Byssothecium circinans]|uniref:Actin-like ATPase domain-containing protein n=1 Tax=Byssothecium circinans TaxID=147558 RepID=A0A6A5TY24_9PLEO|nr:hypothetical protein CC80DRAFT_547240 [Byssothecium circinans]
MRSSSTLGISLSADHGVVSAREQDGTFRDVGKVEGGVAYLDLMKRLSLQTSEHPSHRPYGSPPYGSPEDLWDDHPRQILRNIRKAVGLPASSDVAILSSVVRKLAKIAGPSSSTIISYPALPGLYQDDIADVATYLGIRVLPGNHRYAPHTITAAYAGHDMGLCESFLNEDKCTEEGLKLPVRYTLLIEVKNMDLATSFDLGNADPSEPDVFAKIRDLVTQILRTKYGDVPHPPEIIKVIMTGRPDRVSDAAFRRAINDGIKASGFEADILDDNPDYVSARGAAKLAWRALMLHEQVEL